MKFFRKLSLNVSSLKKSSAFSIVEVMILVAITAILAVVISRAILGTRFQLTDSRVRMQMDNMIQTVTNYGDSCRSFLEAAKTATDPGGPLAGQGYVVTINQPGGVFTGGSVVPALSTSHAMLIGPALVDLPSQYGVSITNAAGKPLNFSEDDIRFIYFSTPSPHYKLQYRTIGGKKRIQGNSLVYGDHRKAFLSKTFGEWLISPSSGSCTPTNIPRDEPPSPTNTPGPSGSSGPTPTPTPSPTSGTWYPCWGGAAGDFYGPSNDKSYCNPTGAEMAIASGACYTSPGGCNACDATAVMNPGDWQVIDTGVNTCSVQYIGADSATRCCSGVCPVQNINCGAAATASPSPSPSPTPSGTPVGFDPNFNCYGSMAEYKARAVSDCAASGKTLDKVNFFVDMAGSALTTGSCTTYTPPILTYCTNDIARFPDRLNVSGYGKTCTGDVPDPGMNIFACFPFWMCNTMTLTQAVAIATSQCSGFGGLQWLNLGGCSEAAPVATDCTVTGSSGSYTYNCTGPNPYRQPDSRTCQSNHPNTAYKCNTSIIVYTPPVCSF